MSRVQPSGDHRSGHAGIPAGSIAIHGVRRIALWKNALQPVRRQGNQDQRCGRASACRSCRDYAAPRVRLPHSPVASRSIAGCRCVRALRGRGRQSPPAPPYPQPPAYERNCPRCGSPTIVRQNSEDHGFFLGCVSPNPWLSHGPSGPFSSNMRAEIVPIPAALYVVHIPFSAAGNFQIHLPVIGSDSEHMFWIIERV